jgi:hypothetical protein
MEKKLDNTKREKPKLELVPVPLLLRDRKVPNGPPLKKTVAMVVSGHPLTVRNVALSYRNVSSEI